MAEYIDRQAVLDELDEDIAEFVECDYALKATKRYIKKIPAADVRPVKHGHWIPVTNGRGGNECSECHNYAPSYQTGAEYLTKFCPNCGADMREGEKKA